MIHAALMSSVLIPVILLFRRMFRKQVPQRLIYGLWLLAALRLLLPLQISCLPLGRQAPALPAAEFVAELSQTPVAGAPAGDAGDGKTDATAAITWGQIALPVWLGGAAVMGLWFLWVNMGHKRQLLRHGVPQTPEGCPIAVVVTPGAESPCLVGLIRPRIALPPESATETRLKYTLAHELSHYRQKDHIWALVRCLCLCLYWYHPLVWVAALCSRRDCELACDEGALALLGEEERLAYGAALIATAAQCSRKNPVFSPVHMADAKTQLKERMELIVKKQKNYVVSAICMVLVCILCAGCSFLSSQAPREAAPTEQPNLAATEPKPAPEPTQEDARNLISLFTGNLASGEQPVVSIATLNGTDTMSAYIHGGANPHYIGNDGNIYFITGRNTIVRCLPDGSRVLVLYAGTDRLLPVGCDGEAFFFIEGRTIMAMNCLSGEVKPYGT